jgi:acyl-CoA reductase-like NAD-dependent aldehyde dehydrogenase
MLYQEELFGPVASFIENDEEAIGLSKRYWFGLGSSIFQKILKEQKYC